MKIQFLTHLNVADISNSATSELWELLAPLVVKIDCETYAPLLPLDHTIIIPTGFITNFGSVPRLPFAYFLAGGIANKECTMHDWLYNNHIFSRAICDDLFLLALKNAGIGFFTRQAMYYAVRVFGSKYYKEN